jgi:hypothetical protein
VSWIRRTSTSSQLTHTCPKPPETFSFIPETYERDILTPLQDFIEKFVGVKVKYIGVGMSSPKSPVLIDINWSKQDQREKI